jgi:hypothetical protein
MFAQSRNYIVSVDNERKDEPADSIEYFRSQPEDNIGGG